MEAIRDLVDDSLGYLKSIEHTDERLLVHCRGGVGRTGTFCALQNLVGAIRM